MNDVPMAQCLNGRIETIGGTFAKICTSNQTALLFPAGNRKVIIYQGNFAYIIFLICTIDYSTN